MTEYERAKTNIKRYILHNEKNEFLWICQEHKSSCQRFLEFLERLIRQTTIKESTWVLLHINPQITDLKNTIQEYNKNGI